MKNYRKVIWAAVCALVFLGTISPAYAKEAGASARSIEEITDEYVEKALSQYHVAGAAVSVVKDGKVLFEKGYGRADLENNVPVDVKTTVFQIASVSKLFTATAVMQMVEQGRLSLDEDVNNYLTAFKINNPYSKPVTLRTLLTHTSGLDFRVPLLIPSSGDVLFDSLGPLENDLKDHLTPVIREPGTFCQYNGYGIALAGYLAEIVSGKPLDRYIAENILEPLEMNHSSYGLTEPVLSYMSKPYRYLFGNYHKQSYTLLSDHPAGSICASASDMANFMLAHLKNGDFNGKRILNPDTAIAMHAHAYPEDDRLTGFGLGFYEGVRNGYKTIEFGGHLPCFSSKVSLLPEKNVGVFVAINTDSDRSGKVCNEYIDLIYKSLTDSRTDEASKTARVTFDMDADKLSGTYSFSEYGETDSSKLKSVMITSKVKCDNNGNLNFSSSEFNWNFCYVGNGMFYCRENGNYCRFYEINGKQVVNILGFDFLKVDAAVWGLFVLSMLCQLIFVISIVLLLRSLIKNRRQETRLIRGARVALVSAAVLIIAYFTLSAITSLLYITGDTFLVVNVIQPITPAVCWLCAGAALALIVFVAILWIKKQAGLKARIMLSVLAALYVPNIVLMYLMNGMKF
jgi:CubicO group peptidase (beta-lactamase class C family)